MRELAAEIESFIGYFRDHRAKIGDLGKEKDHRLYKKQLYVAILDALSRSVFPRRNNRDRFVGVVLSFGEWIHAERISLSHLVRLLAKAPDPAFSELREWALGQIEKWSPGELVQLTRDPKAEEVRKFWPRDSEHRTPIEGITLESLQHAHLLYGYRNRLVHEFRSPGYSIEFDHDEQPFYMSLSKVNENFQEIELSWELSYPAAFFGTLCDNCIKNLEEYLKRNRLDPRASFVFGSYWLEELNR